ncbi:MAG: hypothetical protein O7G87_19015 [bacterium]|nr:hypothetical protein [bacterium]
MAQQNPYRNPIIFARTHFDETTGDIVHNGKIWIMEEDGSEQRQLTEGDSYDDHPALFSDGRHALYSEFNSTHFSPSTPGGKLFKIDIYTGEKTIYAEKLGCTLHHVTISPIDDILMYQRNVGKHVYQRVEQNGEIYELPMRAINGIALKDSVIFMHEKNMGLSPRQVALVRMYGHGKDARATFLTNDACLHRRPAVSPDGEWMAWQTNVEGGEDEVYLARVDGSEARNITNAEGLDGHPWFSRDGKWIVFESDRTGTMEIWKINLETLEQHQLTFSGKAYSCRTPRW